MTEREMLLRAVCENPADDTVRLAFADWCEEHGEGDRAEFIRVQCGLYGWPLWTRQQLAIRADQLLSRRGWQWADLPGCSFHTVQLVDDATSDPDRTHRVAEFARGFVSEVTCTLADWLAHGPAIVAAHPVTRVTLSDREPWNFGGTDRQHGWWRDGGPQVHNRASIPPEIYGRLRETLKLFGTKAWVSRELALEALSDACVAWGRKLAGLSPLKD